MEVCPRPGDRADPRELRGIVVRDGPALAGRGARRPKIDLDRHVGPGLLGSSELKR